MGYWGGWGPCCCGATATVTGSVLNGCSTAQGMASASVTVGPVGGGTPFGILTANSLGVFSGQVTIPSSPIQATVTAAINPTDPHAARYTTTSATVTLTSGQATNAGSLFLPAATGYHCLGLFNYPLPNTLHLTDSKNGSYTLTWSSTNHWSSPSVNINFPGCNSPFCSAINNVPCSYTLATITGPPSFIDLNFSYRRQAANSCPTTSGTIFFSIDSAVTPTADPFHISQAVPSNNAWYCGVSHTWTVTE